jgi:hypothetical protein
MQQRKQQNIKENLTLKKGFLETWSVVAGFEALGYNKDTNTNGITFVQI